MSITTINKFVITNTQGDLFWTRNSHYGYTGNNEYVYHAMFSNSILEATLLSKEAAEGILANFRGEGIIKSLYVSWMGDKIDLAKMLLKEVEVSYKIKEN